MEQKPIAQREASKIDYVRFDVQPEGKQTDTHWRYKCSYQKEGKTAKFAIDLQVDGSTAGGVVHDPAQMDDKPHVQFQGSASGRKYRAGRGSIVAQSGSDASILLTDLHVALEAEKTPSHKMRIRQLPFDFAVLGEHMTPAANDKADFVDSANGKWTALKLFIGPPTDEVQVFLNFEARGGQGEFSLKDPAYGDKLLQELAKVL